MNGRKPNSSYRIAYVAGSAVNSERYSKENPLKHHSRCVRLWGVWNTVRTQCTIRAIIILYFLSLGVARKKFT